METTIIKKDVFVTEKFENGKLQLFAWLWNAEKDIPKNWHDIENNDIELELNFSLEDVVQNIIWNYEIYEEEGKTYFKQENKELIMALKNELKLCLYKLNNIGFGSK